MPEYPAIAKVLQASGDVVCKVWVDVDGHVINAGLVSGPLTLQGTALDALRKWTFKPVQANGDAAEMETTITIRFQIVSPGSLSTVVRLVE
jgi:TonB family protein